MNNKYLGSYVIIRSTDAGCFAGVLDSLDLVSRSCVLKEARRLWYWSGAASLSEMAIRGLANPADCKFPEAVSEQIVFEIIEVIPCSDVAKNSIQGVKPWSIQ